MTKKRIIVALSVIVVVALGYYLFFAGDKAETPEYMVLARRDIRQEVSVTGRVKPAQNVDLAFETGGRVSRVYVSVGGFVQNGQILAELFHGDLDANLREGEAAIASAKAKLADLRAGTRPEEINVAEVKVANAETSVQDAKINLRNKINDAYTKSDDAIRNKFDQFMTNPRSANPKLTFLADAQSQSEVESTRIVMEDLLNKWFAGLDSISSANVKSNLDSVQSFLGRAALLLNVLSPTTNLTQTTIDKYKTDISTARSNIDTAIANVAAADEDLRDAQSSLALAEEELKLKQAGTVAGQIAIQEAEVARAEASLENTKAKIAQTRIIAPISGVITKQDTHSGEIVAQNISVISLISASKFQIEANVPEADIAKVVRGQQARVTLDAYGPDVNFEASVVSIDPAETVIDGVPTYKTTLQFSKDDNRIKSGMTANVDIEGDKRSDVLAIPQRAVITKDGEKTARILNKDLTETEVRITTGLRGSDGFIEILDGLKEGDRIITTVYEK